MAPRLAHRRRLLGVVVTSTTFLVLWQALVQRAAAERMASTEFRSDGMIVCGAKSVRVTRGGQVFVTLGNEKAIKIDQQMSVGTRGWTYPPAFGGKELKIHREERRVEFTGRIPFTKAGDGPAGDYRLSMGLVENGLVQLRTSYSLPEGEHKVRYDHILLQLPFGLVASRTMRVDQKEIAFSAPDAPLAEQSEYVFPHQKAKSIELFRDEPDRHVRIDVLEGSYVFVREQRIKGGHGEQCAIIGVGPLKREAVITFDIRRASAEALTHSEDYFEGIDFYKSDQLHIPRYGLWRNLVQNPSFEAGLRYWRYSTTWLPPEKFGEPYVVDDSVAHSGRRSCRFYVEKDRRLRGLATFAIPTEAGKPYTFSFYAKTQQPGMRVNVAITTALWGVFPKTKNFTIGKEWQRHSHTFVAPNNGVTMMLRGLSSFANQDRDYGLLWVDDVQFEKGECTDYTQKPVLLDLVTNQRDSLFEPGEVIDARLIVRAKPEANGKIAVTIEDFEDAVVWRGDFDFECNDAGEAAVPLPLDGKLPRGIFYVSAKVKTGDSEDRDFFRITVMDFLESRHRHRALCGTCIGPGPDQPRYLQRLRRIGIGTLYDRPQSKAWYDDLAAQDLEPAYTNLFPKKRVGKTKLTDLKAMEELTPELQKLIHEQCRKLVLEYPYLKRWKLIDEPPSTMDPTILAKIAEVAHRAIKETNPEALVMCHTPCNMAPTAGTRDVDRFLAAGGIKYVDIIGINCYRHQPDNPDLDADLQTFLDMLKKHGYDGEVNLCGSYHQNYNLPAYGLDAHKGCSSDHCRLGAFSYHAGWGERMCAAYTARSWLIGYKYASRVRSFIDWAYGIRYLLDIDFTPYAVSVVPNTLGTLLGNADFVEDVTFDAQIRCYLFKDAHDRPIAAIWPMIDAVDRRKQEPPVLRVPGADASIEVMNLMGATKDCLTGEGVEAALTPYPIFIRGAPRSLKELRQLLQNAKVTGTKPQVVQVLTRNVGTKVEIVFRNPLSRPLAGRAEVKMGKQTVFGERLRLVAKAEHKLSLSIADCVRASAFSDVALKAVFRPDGGAPVEIDASFRVAAAERTGKAIVADGDLSDWEGIPAIALPTIFYECEVPIRMRKQYPKPVPWRGLSDLSAQMRVAWDSDALYIAAVISDDVFAPHDAPGPASWKGDCLQLYFDTWCDARSRAERGFDYNDYNYDICPGTNGSCAAFRRVAPEQQLAFLKPNVFEEGVKCACRREEGRTVYEIAFPKRYLQPISFEAGTAFGFAAFIPDHDRDYLKRGLTTTGIPQTSPYMRPHLWPVLVLVE